VLPTDCASLEVAKLNVAHKLGLEDTSSMVLLGARAYQLRTPTQGMESFRRQGLSRDRENY
jgi:hypothetical protein